MSTLAREQWWGLLALAAWLGAGLLAVVLLAAGVRGVPTAPAAVVAPVSGAFAWPAPVVPAAPDWSVLQRVKAAGAGGLAAAPRRFRLAGTFFAFDREAAGAERQAVIEDLQQKTQYLLKEGGVAGDLTLLRVLADRVTIRVQEREEELRLSFKDNLPVAAAVASATNAEPAALETTRFGKRVGENRWVISREALMQYYDELRKDPERVVALFDSLKPVYQDKAITGYVLGMEGEQEFFQAAGLQNGDVVRKVNSINMSSQKRAEYLIREFLQSRISALVFDIERDNQAQKLIYFIR